MIEDQVAAQIEAIVKKMSARKEAAGLAIKKSVTKACLLVERDAKQLMTDSPATGRVYWEGAHHSIEHRASAPGEPPAVDTGLLRASVTHAIEESFAMFAGEGNVIIGATGRVGTHELVGLWMETGTSKMAPRPWLTVALNINKQNIRDIFAGDVRTAMHMPEEVVSAPDIVDMSGEWGTE